MVSPRTIQKDIDGTTYRYDRWLDIIFSEPYTLGVPFSRTQTARVVDLCLEVTTWCNFACENCFSRSHPAKTGRHLPVGEALSVVQSRQADIVRVCVTGGEPLMHPDIEDILLFPAQFAECGFVLTTNGSLRKDLDPLIAANEWLTAVSLHGRKQAHERYTGSNSFDLVTSRIKSLARRAVVHIYSVVHDSISRGDVDYLFSFRDEVGARFLRFMVPRPHGRYQPLTTRGALDHVCERLDARSGLKMAKSGTTLLTVDGELTRSS
jgi:molybdenum cofactor biosynthesis enzyme MoaA